MALMGLFVVIVELRLINLLGRAARGRFPEERCPVRAGRVGA